MAKDADDEYSPLIKNLKDCFESHVTFGSRYLMVYWQGYGQRMEIRSVTSGQYPWAAHDSYMAEDNSASILAIAFDLTKSFDEQIPEHMKQFETLECFAYRPLIHIPDRTGRVPAEKEQEIIKALLHSRPELRVIK